MRHDPFEARNRAHRELVDTPWSPPARRHPVREQWRNADPRRWQRVEAYRPALLARLVAWARSKLAVTMAAAMIAYVLFWIVARGIYALAVGAFQ